VARLLGRPAECAALDRLLDAVRAGESRALAVQGEPGAGKTALLDYLARRTAGCRVARATGVQSEMELAFAGLHQVCAPLLDRLEALPGPQRDALRTAFGRRRIGRWPRPLICGLTQTGGPGTGPRPRPGRMRRSPPSWSARPTGRGRAGAWPRRRRSWSTRRC
jgi:AAA ATPase domain